MTFFSLTNEQVSLESDGGRTNAIETDHRSVSLCFDVVATCRWRKQQANVRAETWLAASDSKDERGGTPPNTGATSLQDIPEMCLQPLHETNTLLKPNGLQGFMS